jgi:hypothetical protein
MFVASSILSDRDAGFRISRELSDAGVRPIQRRVVTRDAKETAMLLRVTI